MLTSALHLAIQAARRGGERILADFARPRGPRGAGENADVDTEVELEVRAMLLEAFPEWSFLGEETGRVDNTGPGRWVVDPNDGTNAFLKGLLWDGEPVLGVVFSPLYPDHEGDLLAWARGCGPLTRTGVEVAAWELWGELSASQSGGRARQRSVALPVGV